MAELTGAVTDRTGPAVEPGRTRLTAAAAMLCVAGGLGQLVVVQQQLVHGIGAALPFLVAAAVQLALARLVWAAGRPAVLLLTAGALCAIISLYVVGVMAGVTVGPHGEAVRADPVRTVVVVAVVVVAQLGAVAFLLRGLGGHGLGYFAAEPMRVSSTSMVPTFRSGDQVLVDKLAYREDQPRRGDLVVFDGSPDRLLKRVVAIPGDEVGIEDGVLVVNGRPVEEPTVDRRQVDGSYFGPEQVPAGTVFVLGDNRANSVDSRTTGPVPVTDLVGRIVLRLWPRPGVP